MNPTEIFSAPLLPEATRPACVWGEARVVDGTLAIDCVQQTPYGAVRLDSRSWPLAPISTLAVIAAKTLTEPALYTVVARYFGADAPRMWRTIGCETGHTYRLDAHAGPFWFEGRWVNYYGIGQVDPYIWGDVPADAEGQIAQLRRVFDEQGWSAWPVCSRVAA